MPYRKERKISHLASFIFFGGFGIIIMMQPGDFLIVRGSPVSKVLLIIFTFSLSFFGLYLYLFRHPSESERIVFVCLHCKRNFFKNELKDSSCPMCSGTVEDAKGLFDRHPDLLKDDETET